MLSPSHQRRMLTTWQRHHNGGRLKFWVIDHSRAHSVGGTLQWTTQLTRTQAISQSHSAPQWDDDHNWGFATTTIDRGFSACPVLHICFPGVNRACRSDIFSAIDTSRILKSKAHIMYLHFYYFYMYHLLTHLFDRILIVKEIFKRVDHVKVVLSKLMPLGL